MERRAVSSKPKSKRPPQERRTLANMPPIDETQYHTNETLWQRYLQECRDNWLGVNDIADISSLSTSESRHRHTSYRQFIQDWNEVMHQLNTLPNGKRRRHVFEVEQHEESEFGAELVALKNHIARVYISLIDDDDE